MTEQEWLSCNDPAKMLASVHGKVSSRKFRLFAVGCCRHIWNSLTDDRSRNVVDVAERFADGEATERELSQARSLAHNAGWDARLQGDDLSRLFFPAFMAVPTDRLPQEFRMLQTDPDLLRAAPPLCRCVFGNLTRPTRIEGEWQTSAVANLAQAIYTDRAFDRMPILADALEEAGCTDKEILVHCRSGQEHVRGCWVVDLLLGKE